MSCRKALRREWALQACSKIPAGLRVAGRGPVVGLGHRCAVWVRTGCSNHFKRRSRLHGVLVACKGSNSVPAGQEYRVRACTAAQVARWRRSTDEEAAGPAASQPTSPLPTRRSGAGGAAPPPGPPPSGPPPPPAAGRAPPAAAPGTRAARARTCAARRRAWRRWRGRAPARTRASGRGRGRGPGRRWARRSAARSPGARRGTRARAASRPRPRWAPSRSDRRTAPRSSMVRRPPAAGAGAASRGAAPPRPSPPRPAPPSACEPEHAPMVGLTDCSRRPSEALQQPGAVWCRAQHRTGCMHRTCGQCARASARALCPNYWS